MKTALKDRVIGFIETNKTKRKFCTKKVFTPSKLKLKDNEAIIVATSETAEVEKSIKDCGIDESKVIFLFDFNKEIKCKKDFLQAALGPNIYDFYMTMTNLAPKVCSHGQLKQDIYVLFLMWQRNDLAKKYIDIGANDGVTFSNSLLFEQLGWDGICIEPNRDVFELLQKNRKCIKYDVAIADKCGTAKFTKIKGPHMLSGLTDSYDERHKVRINKEIEEHGGSYEEVEVKVSTLNKIIEEHPEFKDTSYISIDVEGAEEKILYALDFDCVKPYVLTVENAYNTEEIRTYMKNKGYDVIKVAHDDFYILE